jgi:hypothetical protein
MYNMIERSDNMPTNKPRAMITFNDEQLYKAVDEYRFQHRFRSQNEALMDLINKGIEKLMGETPIEPAEKLTDEDRRVLTAYHAAEPVYQGIALEILESHQAKQEKSRA